MLVKILKCVDGDARRINPIFNLHPSMRWGRTSLEASLLEKVMSADAPGGCAALGR